MEFKIKNYNRFFQNYWGYCLLALAVILIIYFVWPRQHLAEITGVEWSRYYQIQVLKTVRVYDDESPPIGARIFNVDLEEECETTGVGKDAKETCEWVKEYDYDHETYVNNRIVEANGDHRSAPYWPKYTLAESNGAAYGVGKERMYDSIERYTLYFKAKDGTIYNDNLPMVEWKLYEPRQIVYLTVSLGIVVKIRSLEN